MGDINTDLVDTDEFTTNYSIKPDTYNEQEPADTQEFKIGTEEHILYNTCLKFDKPEDEGVTSPLNKVSCECRDQTDGADIKCDNNKYNLKPLVIVIERDFKEFEPKGTIHTDEEQKPADAQEFKIEIEEHNVIISDTSLKHYYNTKDEEVTSPLNEVNCEYRDQTLNEIDLKNYNEIYKLKPLVVLIERGFKGFKARGINSNSKTKVKNSNQRGKDINVELNTFARNSRSEDSIKSQSKKTGRRMHKLSNFSAAVPNEGGKEYFQCPYCESKLTTKNSLKRHLNILHSENNIRYECDSCGHKSKRKDALMVHIRNQHSTNRKMYHCQLCEFRSKCKSSLDDHVTCKHDESAEWYFCDSCNYKARVKSYVMIHQKRHEANRKVHHCRFCGRTFTKDYLRKHLIRQHAADMETTNDKTHLSQETRSNDPEKVSREPERKKVKIKIKDNEQDETDFHCQFCEVKVKTKHTLKWHVYYKHSGKAEWYQCRFCEYKTIHKNYLKSHVNYKHNEEAELYRCNSCNFETKLKSNLVVHLKVKHTVHIQEEHTKNTKIYHCQNCVFKTKHNSSLKMHIRRMHTKDIPLYKCEFCELKTNKYALARHIKLIHGKDFELYQCQECEYSTKHKHSLKKHIKAKHTKDNVEMIQCELCEYKAKIKWQLSAHFKRMHAENPFVHHCQHCGYKAKNKYRLKEHFNAKHSEMPEWHQCHLCSYKTKTKRNLKLHIGRDHDGIIQCEFCEYKTLSSHNMTVHMKTAHEEKGQYFTCVLCGYKTVGKAWLKVHFKITHDTEPEWFYCYLCDYKAKLKSYLIGHIQCMHRKYNSRCQSSKKN